MTDQQTPLTQQQLDEYEQLIGRTTPLGAATASPGMAAALLAEVRRLRAELATARATVFGEAEQLIAEAIEWNRTEYPAVGGMITRRLGMRAAERVVRALREEAEGGCPGFEGNPVAPDLCAGCHEPRDTHDAATSAVSGAADSRPA
ncbi:hypothetical protein ACIA6D_23345 [Streptomyces cacaoi]